MVGGRRPAARHTAPALAGALLGEDALAPDHVVEVELGGVGGTPEGGAVVEVDADHPQALVPGGTWQRTVPRATDALVSCLVSPGFDFDDFELA